MAPLVDTIPYSAEAFQSIPRISLVCAEFAESEGKKYVHGVLGPLIERHGFEEIFGVGLIHRHFNIESKEKLVEFNNVTTPWIVSTEKVNKVQPSNTIVYETSWILNDDGRRMAYEFAFSPTGPENKNIVDIKDKKYRQFIAEFTAAITSAGYAKMLGLRAWPGKGFRGGLEISEPKANIFLQPHQFKKMTNIYYSETMWFFAPEFTDADCKCDCGWRNGWHIYHDHSV